MSEARKYATILIRRLREGKTYDDFVAAWYPDKGFGFSEGFGPITARNATDEREILTVALFELPPGESLEALGERIAAQEAVRHERIEEVIESTTLRGVYEVLDEFDFGTDGAVAARRPDSARDR